MTITVLMDMEIHINMKHQSLRIKAQTTEQIGYIHNDTEEQFYSMDLSKSNTISAALSFQSHSHSQPIFRLVFDRIF